VATINYKIGDKVGRLQRTMGKIPLMVKSTKCHLDGMSPAELVHAREEGTELGGYFIINGLEKLIRLICMPKRNFVRLAPVLVHALCAAMHRELIFSLSHSTP
jgi:DNA-directed RNA polymerase I subunit RPA2